MPDNDNELPASSKAINDASANGFLKTGGGQTKSNAIQVPAISLPAGGGAIKAMDEKFSVNAVNGTAAFSIQLPFSAARGAVPAVNLSYSSGSGNGIFGLGWSTGLMTIKRKTNNALPQYADAAESDTFLLSEAEDLVPAFKRAPDGSFLLDNAGDYIIDQQDSPDGLFIIRFYKPRTEGLFARIERWQNKTSGELAWRVISKDNSTTLFGWTAAARIADPGNSARIFEWLPEFVFDDKGNCAHYIYLLEDEKGIDTALLQNKNRLAGNTIKYTNRYPGKMLYGNKTPYKKMGDPFPAATDYLFSNIFDYGEYDQNPPYNKITGWSFRPDPFSDYKAGFEIRTTRLCKRVLLFHHFAGAGEYDGLVKSLNFDYDTTQPGFTFLTAATAWGYIKKEDGSYTSKQLPAMEFTYQQHTWDATIKTIAPADAVHAPVGLDEQQYQFTDLFNEGLSGILTEQANGWYYKHNLGDGKFEPAQLVTPKPSFTGLGTQLQLTDLDADGGKQLVNFSTVPGGYFELDDNNEWMSFRNFQTLPNVNFSDDNTKMLDLNGDGKPEILISEETVFTWYPSEGRKGFAAAQKTSKPFDEESGPAVIFADEKQTLFLADMSGDGLTDLVRIRNGEICYWPNLGFGKFGEKVAMDNAPRFDHPDAFNAAWLRLADIDGSGTPDIIYLGRNKFTCWMNQHGNSFSTVPFEIDSFPEIHNRAKITVTDLLGNGVACIVWTGGLPKDANASIKYIDLMNSRKPHLMVAYKNNLGKEVSLEYTASTKFYTEDKASGHPWITKLHFPVHCISETETRDIISGTRFVSTYKYHHGYYDHPEREFRGFGMVEQTDAEHFEDWVKGSASNITNNELHQEPVVSKNWFHTGAFINREKILNQFMHEYWYQEMEKQGFPVTLHEASLVEASIVAASYIDPSVINTLSAEEWRQALRACKGMPLRAEVFANDAVKNGNTTGAQKKALTPYSVSDHNCLVELLQPKGKNKYAVYAVKESEAITYHYERDPNDPRIMHQLNIRMDEFGNVLESATVVYPRLTADVSLPAETRQEQARTSIIFTSNTFTNDVVDDDTYRLRMPATTITYELNNVSKTGEFYTTDNFVDILTDAKSDAALYHELDKPPGAGKAQRRMIEHIRSTYYRNDLSAALPLRQLESLALPFESYQLAYTPELLNDIFSAKVANPADWDLLMEEGKFTHPADENNLPDNNWWIRSGTAQFIEGAETNTAAQGRFYMPVSYTDPFAAKTTLRYYSNYFLFIEKTTDALGNETGITLFNFRTLSPQQMKDINGNLSETISDELGMVKATAIMGKGNEADELTGLTAFTEAAEKAMMADFFQAPDSVQLTSIGKNLLQHASTRFVYDLDVYKNTGKPAVVASVVREEHFVKNNNAPVQISFEYSNGLGKVVMKKVQAAPGMAKQVTVNADNTYTVTDTDTDALNPKQLRWVGNGKTILNNKGNAVKQYEPYFSITPQYEDFKELVETGVTPVMYYDAAGRLLKTEMPDGSFSKIIFDSWKQTSYDTNDTVTDSLWWLRRTDNSRPDFIADLKEQAAAAKAAKHANTPNEMHLDTLGRPVLSIDHNRNIQTDADEFYHTKVKIDTEGNLRSVTDARNNTVIQYKYDMLGKPVYQDSMDAGQRWMLTNITGKPLRTWDERNHLFQYFYDELQRLLQSKVIGGDGETPLDNIFDRIFYGESLLTADRSNEAALQATNVLGKPIRHFDTAGMVDTPAFDFKGKPLSAARQLYKNYKIVVNWVDANLINDLEADHFTFTTETDALGRIFKQTAPDGSIITPSYNETGLLHSEQVRHAGSDVENTYIKNIDYNEKGRRNKIIYGNDVATKFYYDKETFRITRIDSKKNNNEVLQDLYYTYDPAGNITAIEDKAIPIQFFANSMIEPLSEYSYDALYRLSAASGRENNAALNYGDCDNWNDNPFMQSLSLGDAMAVRNYTQSYAYDAVGNMQQMKHLANAGNWTRNYEYEPTSNRLKNTSIGDNGNPANYTKYTHHDKHGFLLELPHLETIAWNFKEEVLMTTRQHCTADNIPVITYYQYDGQGQRIRKITENGAAAGAVTTKKEERIYIAGYELYKKHTGANASLERTSLSLLEGGHRFVMVETRNDTDDGTDKTLVRYQLHNHIGAAAMELDATARLVSYEEYHPFGTTAYQATNRDIKSASKRYRYTGMERDEETGLEYHSARYYLPWLGRWMSCDPIGIGDGVNVFIYCHNNPVTKADTKGTQAAPESGDSSLAGIRYRSHTLFSLHPSEESSGTERSQPIRSSFTLHVPGLGVSTTGIADGTTTLSTDTSGDTGQLRFRGGVVLGDSSGFNLALTGSTSLQVPSPGNLQLTDPLHSVSSVLPRATGDLRFFGTASAGSFVLGEVSGRASVDSGHFRASAEARTFASLGRLHLTATGTFGDTAEPSIGSVSATARLEAPGISVDAQAKGTANAEGGVSYTASADLRLLGIPSLHLRGSGTVSGQEANFTGTFSGAGPLGTSYITGSGTASTREGIAGTAAIFGLTYSPSVTLTDPAPTSPVLRAAGERVPWQPGGLTVGASVFRLRQGNVDYLSAGFMPDLSENFARNPRFGLTGQLHF